MLHGAALCQTPCCILQHWFRLCTVWCSSESVSNAAWLNAESDPVLHYKKLSRTSRCKVQRWVWLLCCVIHTRVSWYWNQDHCQAGEGSFCCKSLQNMFRNVFGPLAASWQVYTFRAMQYISLTFTSDPFPLCMGYLHTSWKFNDVTVWCTGGVNKEKGN
jgi:hypothetical protein